MKSVWIWLVILASAFKLEAQELTIHVDTAEFRLWAERGGEEVFPKVPVAIGMNAGLEYFDRSTGRRHRFYFSTPTGRHRVQYKRRNPVWRPPDWHYFEKMLAHRDTLELVRLRVGSRVPLSDGSFIAVFDSTGRVYRVDGPYRYEWTPGIEIIVDGKLFMPPLGSPQRTIPDMLGEYGLYFGDGNWIHGTNPNNPESVYAGRVSHGCIRMRNEDLARLYELVPNSGTLIIIH